MDTTRRKPWTVTGVVALVAGAVCVGVLGTGAFTLVDLADSDDCEGTEQRVQQVADLKVLHSPPTGARPAKGFEEADTGCLDDSGDEVLWSSRTYDSALREAAVLAHYRAWAKDDGWQEREPTYGEAESPEDPDAVKVCFTKDVPGGPVRLSLRYEYDAPQRFVLSAESDLDGAGLDC
ncbi:hypothetical protein [Streptomyces sp. NPDC005955]|uniref:hypothetical protein n=1 Tax=Streptomyces sp. NPDC005955 TaxID=3364738 RepID=UPI003677042C